MSRRYASNTSVPVARSRGAIDTLLRDWGCKRIAWEDDFEKCQATLRFVWEHQGADFPARFVLQMEEGAQDQRSAHRVLFNWLKGSLNAVHDGIVSAEALFLPWLEDPTGKTVAEAILPRIQELIDNPAQKVLRLPSARSK